MNELEVNKKIEQRLRILMGHSNALIEMLDRKRDYKDVFLQVHALKGAIKGVEGLLIEKYVDESLVDVPKNKRKKVNYLFKLLDRP